MSRFFCRHKVNRSSTLPTPHYKQLHIEALEQKNLLAGDVAVSLVSGDLLITGDADPAGHQFNMVQTASDTIELIPVDGTTINGGVSALTFNFAGDVTVDLRAGDGGSVLSVTGLGVGDGQELPGDFNFLGGAGADSVGLSEVRVAGDLNWDLGDGENDVTGFAVKVDEDFRLVDGDDNGSYEFENTVVGDDLYVTGGDGADEFGFASLEVIDRLRISAGGGDDHVFLEGAITVGRSALVSLGDGTNTADFNEVIAGRSLTVLGRGTNTINLFDVKASHFVTIITASGDDVVNLNYVTTASAMVATNAGVDDVTIADSIFDYLYVLLGSGDDTLTLDNVTVNRYAFLSGGSGEDTLVDVDDANTINFAIDFAFESFSV